MSCCVPVIIPAYEPDEHMINLLTELSKTRTVIVVDDGSGFGYDDIFQKAEELIGKNGTVIRYSENRGKGYALRTAFKFVLREYKEAIGVVTADSDGQHSVEALEKVTLALQGNPTAFILGSRNFDDESVPFKSSFGNKITRMLLSVLSGIKISDTQTGLRGIPISFLETLSEMNGDRFEYEMQMLIEATKRFCVVEVPITTVYIDRNRKTHFRAIKDSFRIYRIVLNEIFRFALSSLLAFCVDIIVFWTMCRVLVQLAEWIRIPMATVCARAVSVCVNYMVNKYVVFGRKDANKGTVLKYILLSASVMGLSLLFTTLIVCVTDGISPVIIKVIVDTCLFALSFIVQKRFIFN